MKKIDDYLQLYRLESEKDYEKLVSGDGFVLTTAESTTLSMHPKEPANYIALLEFTPDIPRGNHYHLKKIEYMVILSGTIKWEFYLVDDKSQHKEIIMEPRDVVKIMPGCVHTLTAIGGNAIALEYSPDRFDQDDVFYINA